MRKGRGGGRRKEEAEERGTEGRSLGFDKRLRGCEVAAEMGFSVHGDVLNVVGIDPVLEMINVPYCCEFEIRLMAFMGEGSSVSAVEKELLQQCSSNTLMGLCMLILALKQQIFKYLNL
ncbi:hypothetical protein F0562_019654 [Nyssa sinensis]|uniref:Uncharacterized protein n=1 Tax=Nyssa sinensis TaxID=561372 RepID=A0A5J5BUJ5_9ASTE|nr:hypothetical protein F0562_019654 [Nyssa sinensis]